MKRNNETWLIHLRSKGADQQEALSDLRDALIRSLRGALWNDSLIDDAFLEDTVQDTIIRILERLKQFEGRSRFLTWATSIAIRVAMSELRRHRWKNVSLEEVIADANLAPERVIDDGSEPSIQRERKAVIEMMHGLIQNDLTEKQRVALLAELKEMPQDEIARHIGSNRNAVYKLTHDARKRLKQGFEAVGYEITDIQAIFAN
ncbi:MAG: sigma-70 family RNA polymerase sigma factor [Nitrosomonadaceae bacterium]|jgi:RNA polymerase sigma-70 factor (ECF subfamily)